MTVKAKKDLNSTIVWMIEVVVEVVKGGWLMPQDLCEIQNALS
jgi:hypothetical protein